LKKDSLIFGINTINVGVLGFAALCSIMGLMLSGKNLFTKFDDMLIIGIAILITIWYTVGGNCWKRSPLPILATGITFLTTLVFLIIEAGTESEFDELISLPALAILLVISVYYYQVVIPRIDLNDTTTKA
jgi:hypothetical protein